MKRILFTLFFLTVAGISLVPAQSTDNDSLLVQLQSAEGRSKIPILIELTELNQRENPRAGLDFAAEAESLLVQYPDPVQESQLQISAGWSHYYLRDYEQSMEYANRAEALAQSVSHPEHEARTKLLKGRLYRDENDYNAALNTLNKALALTSADSLLQLRAFILNESGTVYRRQGETGKALEAHLQALELLEKINDKQAMAVTYNFLGIINDIIGNYDEALRYYLQSLEVHEALGNRRSVAASLTNIGTLHQRIEQYDEALDFYEKSLPIWKALKADDPLASTINNMGTVYELMGEYELARSHYEEAYGIWSELDDLYSVTIALDNLSAAYLYLGEYDQALLFKQEAVRNNRKLGNSRGLANTLTNLAEIFLKIDQPDSALSAAQQGLEHALKSGSWGMIRNAHEMLAVIYEHTGNYQQALEQYKLFKAANDTLFNADSQTAIVELQEQYRTQQQQQQIELLEQERELQKLWVIILVGGIALVLIVSGFMFSRFKLKARNREQLHRSEMEKARLQAESAKAKTRLLDEENKRKSKELEDARNLQLSMLPAALPDSRFARIAAFMETAAEVGGDYYDVDQWEDGTLTLVIGDATGHGTKAGLLVMAVKSLFNLTSRERELIDIMRRCSEAIKKMNLPRLYMAFALARIKNSTLELVGAGMPPALIYRVETSRVESVDLKGMPLGSVPDFPYVKTTVELYGGDVLLLLSDGYPELTNDEGAMPGYDNPAKLLAETGHLEPEAIIDHFRQACAKWTQAERPNDDITFLVLKKKN